MSERRDYYVTMLRGKRVAWLLGPYGTHAEALARVDDGKRLASAADPWSDFDAFGTSSLPRWPWNPRGKLNSKLAVDVRVQRAMKGHRQPAGERHHGPASAFCST